MRQDMRSVLILAATGLVLVLLVAPGARRRIELETGFSMVSVFQELDEALKETIRSHFKGMEREAVVLAMGDFRSETEPLRRRRALRVLQSLPDESLTQFRAAFKSGRRPRLAVRRALSSWAFSTQSRDGLILAIDNLEGDPGQTIPADAGGGAVARLCDAAFQVGCTLIDDAQKAFGPIFVADAPRVFSQAVTGEVPDETVNALLAFDEQEARDRELRAFRLWWREKKPYIEWSQQLGRFTVNQDAWRARVPVTAWSRMSDEERQEALDSAEDPPPVGMPGLDIFETCVNGSAARINGLLRAAPGLVAARDAAQHTPLHMAAFFGNEAVVKALIEHGADVDAVDFKGWTPLHWAAAYGQRKGVELLLAAGADVNARTTVGRTPLHAAAANLHRDIAEVLVENGADRAATDNSGQTALSLVRRLPGASAPSPPEPIAELMQLLSAELNG